MQSMSNPFAASYQSWYDEKRMALSLAIDNTIKQLKEMQAANSSWPLHYPSSQNLPAVKPHDDDGRAISVPPKPELLVLQLDLKFGSLHDDKFVQKLGEDAVAMMLEERMRTCIRQLSTLRDRINDPLSKILVTGDVNAGKSTFCNALLRRRILPEDQQPCTTIFCEVLHSKQNSGMEEVHAITTQHAREVFALQDLERVVTDAKYTQCKIFVNDLRTADESLLSSHKEVVDIALIDAPGLNHDTAHTTAVFARQEEIDVVVFVVSAANHFTISAREFIRAVTAEKEYLFIVVNAFDIIRNKERCKSGIMEQIQHLSPQTFKESSDLVHFVSSNTVFAPSTEAQCMNEDRVQDFARMERSLRKFVLEKRARSKLAPAKTYLLNVQHDINMLASSTVGEIQSKHSHASEVVDNIVPQLEDRRNAVGQVGIEMDSIVDETCQKVFDHSRSAIAGAIAKIGDDTDKYEVAYLGPWTAFQYAEELTEAILSRITETVAQCEDDARTHAVRGIDAITQLGILHGRGVDAFERRQFRPEALFSQKRDALTRKVNINIEMQDLINWPPLSGLDKFAGAGMALTLTTAVGGGLTDLHTWLNPILALVRIVDHNRLVRRLLIPGILITAVTAALVHVVREIPHVVPRRLATKIAVQLSAMDYVHANSARISHRVRKALRIPAEDVRVVLDRSVRVLEHQRDQMCKLRDKSHVALKYFKNLMHVSAVEVKAIEEIDLEHRSNDQLTSVL